MLEHQLILLRSPLLDPSEQIFLISCAAGATPSTIWAEVQHTSQHAVDGGRERAGLHWLKASGVCRTPYRPIKNFVGQLEERQLHYANR